MDPELDWIAKATGAHSVRRSPRIQSLWNGYGEIFRAHLSGTEPATAIVKWVKPPARARVRERDPSHARKCRSYDVETAWYRTFSKKCDDTCRVPALIHSQSSKGEWLFLLEDLDAAGYSERRHALTPEELDRCLAWLAGFHARFLGATPNGLWRTGTYWHLETRRDELEAMEDDALREAAPILDRKLRSAAFQTIVHGDAKVANFCFSPGMGGVAAVDFQYVGGGCGMKDVAYLLSDHPSPHSEASEGRHLDTYFVELKAALAGREDVDADALESEWRALYPIACADFYRFLAGWAKEYWKSDSHGQKVARNVLRMLQL